MRKLNYTGRTLDEEIVKDGLKSIGVLDSFHYSRGLYSLIGGIATQSYVPSSFRRPTSDIDLLIGRPLNPEEFREFSKPVIEYLRDHDFEIRTSKRSRSYNLIFENPQNQEALLIEFSRRNNKAFESNGKRIMREIKNSRIKKVEGEKEDTYRVCSPEDITGPKLMRTVNSLKRNSTLMNHLNPYKNISTFSDEFMEKRLEKINNLRDEASMNLGDEVMATELRFCSDIYDIILLMESAGINEEYFQEVLNRWSSLKNPSETRDLVFRTLLSSTLT